jgi:predicted NBD/HSP70 family sugar kinase
MERTSRRDARARVVGVLAEAGAVSRADLARRAALAPSTVSAVVSDLQAAGLVIEPADPVHPPERAAIGRPPVLISLHRKAGVVAGIDFGKRHLRMVISDLSHQLLAENHRALDADLPAREAISLAKLMFEDALDEAGVQRAELVGIGMGLPGPGRRPSGQLRHTTKHTGWVGIRAADAVGKALRHPVEVENDANLGALGEWMWGAGRGADHMAYVKAATGIGAGFIVAGAPYVGAGGTAGEIGHTVVEPGGPICRCGNRGCLETLAGAPAVLSSLRDVHGENLTLTGAVSFAVRGDTGCARAIADAGTAIGTAVATLCNLFNPQKIVVGGDLGTAGDLLLNPLRESLRRGAIRSAADDVEVLQGELGERAEVLGAVALVLGRGAQATTA